MATYNTITDRQEAAGIPAFTTTNGLCGTTTFGGVSYVGTAPTGVNRVYTPKTTREWRVDPTKSMRRNWKKIKSSGEISMTPLSVGREVTEKFVVGTPNDIGYYPGNWAYCGSNSPPLYQFQEYGERHTRWTQNDHIDSLSPTMTPINISKSRVSDFEKQISDAINATQSAAFASSLSSYDVLTELGEARETLGYLRSKVGEAADALRKFAHEDETIHRRARVLTSKQLIRSADKSFRRYGARWMEYRYAIMPLIYSIKDINDLLGKRNEVYKTDRDKSDIRVVLDRPGLSSGQRCLYVTEHLEAIVKSTVKSAYNRGALQRMFSLTSFNPFKTGWELIPYSFVVDWFVNVGDVITSQTSLDLSSQKACCTSVKRTLIRNTWLYDSTVQKSSALAQARTYQGPRQTMNFDFQRNVDGLLQTVATSSYDRFIWSKPEPTLSFDPFYNWKRFLDTLVLGYQPIRKLLRSL